MSVLLVLATLLSLCIFPVSAEETVPADDKFADGHFKVLFIGNSASDDATDSGYQEDSKLYEIMKAMVGDNVKIDIGLCWSGGKTLAWHATVAEAGSAGYTFMYHADGDKWRHLGLGGTSKAALEYTDWDAVVLQPWGLEVTRGKATFANNESDDFVELENSVPYMLDYVATHAPTADIYYYHIWATTHDYQNLDAERKTYESICKYTRLAETYAGTKTGAKFKGVVPAGATVQALRGTYLGLLDVNTDETTIDHTTDPQMGIQRDAVHMSFCIGRYAVGLTFAEKLIPADKRAEGYTLPALRTSQLVGEMPEDYLELIELAVDAAYASAEQTGNKKYNVSPLEGYTESPLNVAKSEMEAHTYSFNNVADAAALEKLWEENLSQGTSVDVKADVTLTSAYTAPAEGESVEVTATVTFTHGYHMTPTTASIKAVVTARPEDVKLNVIAGEGGTVTPSGESKVAVGSDVEITVTADFDHVIGDVKINGVSVGGVKSVEETWWHRVITEMGGNLVRCDSWSGSAICYTGYWGADRSETSSFVGRFQRLKKEGFFEENRIDTVFIFGGTNDTGNDSPLGTSMYEGHSREDLYCVLPAISYLMSELKKTLPDARICFIVNDEYLKSEIRDEFFRCAKYYGKDAVMPEGVDKKGGHPSTLGMEQIAKQVVDYLKNKQ